MKRSSRGILVLLLLASALATRPALAQKSLSDGVEELAARLAKSYGDGKRGKVAIVPLRELGGGENLLGTYIAETLTNSFFEVGYREIVERQMLDRALQELKLSLTGMIDADSAKKIGKFLHADLVVGGTMTYLTSEVSVNCRMFAVETGQVVAVATTKIVKDDSVKYMWEKGTAAAGRSGASGSSGAEPELAGEAAQELHGISFRLKSCSHHGTTVDCDLSITALDADLRVYVSRRSRLVDTQGKEAETSVLSFGDGTELVRGIGRTGHFRFEGVEITGGQVPLIEVQFRSYTSPHDFDGHEGRIQFRKVTVR